MSMSSDDINKYKKLYGETARTYLNDMHDQVSLLVQGSASREILQNIHLCAHSLVGQSRIMGYNNIADFSSIIEKIFKQQIDKNLEIKPEDYPISPNVLMQIQKGIEKMLSSVEEIDKSGKELDMGEEIDELGDRL